MGRWTTYRRQCARLDRRMGATVWCRSLVHLPEDGSPAEAYVAAYPKPAFRCTFLERIDAKYLRVRGADGREYRVHMASAGKNPSVSVPFTPFYRTLLSSSEQYRPHVPGESLPDSTTLYRGNP